MLRIVAKNACGSTYKILGSLSEDDSVLLKRFWLGARLGNRRREVARILSEVHDKNAWLACDCLGDACSSPPILAPRRTSSDSWTVARMANRAPHAHNGKPCAFFWEEGDLCGYGACVDTKKPVEVRPPNFLIYGPDGHSAVSGSSGGHLPGRTQRDASDDPLGRCLFWLLKEAACNTVSSSEPDIHADFVGVHEQAKKIRLFDSSVGEFLLDPELAIAEVLWTSTKAIYKGWAKRKLLTLQVNGNWPENVPLQGLLLLPASEVSGQTVSLGDDERIEIEGTVTCAPRSSGRAHGPFAVLISFQLDQTTGHCKFLRCYAHPREARSLCLVNSDLERKTLQILRWCLGRADPQLNLRIEKPLFPLNSGSPDECLPDFIVRNGSKVLVLETRGDEAPEQAERENEELNTKRKIGDLIIDDRTQGDPKEAGRMFARAVMRWIDQNRS